MSNPSTTSQRIQERWSAAARRSWLFTAMRPAPFMSDRQCARILAASWRGIPRRKRGTARVMDRGSTSSARSSTALRTPALPESDPRGRVALVRRFGLRALLSRGLLLLEFDLDTLALDV